MSATCVCAVGLFSVIAVTLTTASAVSYPVGGLFRLSSSSSNGPKEAAAALLAAEHINRLATNASASPLYGLQPPLGFSIRMIINDTLEDPVVASSLAFALSSGTYSSGFPPPRVSSGDPTTGGLINANGSSVALERILKGGEAGVSEDGVVAFVGPAYSSVSLQLSTVLTQLAKPQISHSATAPALNDQALYPFFCRVVPSDNRQAVVMAQLIRYWGWSKGGIGIVHTTDAYGTGLVDAFVSLAADQNIDIVEVRNFAAASSSSFSRARLRRSLLGIKESRALVILAHFTSSTAREVLLMAHELGMTGQNGYVWLGTDGWVSSGLVSAGSPPQLEEMVAGVVGLRPVDVTEGPFQQLWRADQARLEALFNKSPGSWNNIGTYVPFAYEAVIALGHAMAAVRQQGLSPRNASAMRLAMRQVRYQGVTGAVSFTEDCDGVGDYSIQNYQLPGGFRAVGHVSLTNMTINLDPNRVIVWMDGGTTVPTGGLYRPLTGLSASDADGIAIIVGLLLCFSCAMHLGAFVFSDDEQLKSMSVRLLQGVMVGLDLMVVSALFFAYGDDDAYLHCRASFCFLTTGAALVFSLLALRAQRIRSIFESKRMKATRPVSDMRIFAYALSLCAIFITVIWTVDVKLVRKPFLSDSTMDVLVCEFEQDWPLVSFVLVPLLLVIGLAAWRSFEARHVPHSFNASKATLLSVWMGILLGVIASVVYLALEREPSISVWVFVIAFLLYLPVVELLLVGQFLWYIFNLRRVLQSEQQTNPTHEPSEVRKGSQLQRDSVSSLRVDTSNKVVCLKCGASKWGNVSRSRKFSQSTRQLSVSRPPPSATDRDASPIKEESLESVVISPPAPMTLTPRSPTTPAILHPGSAILELDQMD